VFDPTNLGLLDTGHRDRCEIRRPKDPVDVDSVGHCGHLLPREREDLDDEELLRVRFFAVLLRPSLLPSSSSSPPVSFSFTPSIAPFV
jgi:hypothetical protein